jgi:hypothetical protein
VAVRFSVGDNDDLWIGMRHQFPRS